MMMMMVLTGLVALPALAGYFMARRRHAAIEGQCVGNLCVGDPIVYSMQKASTHPGERAQNVRPAERGDYYYYRVNKFWVVEDVLGDGRIVARTRTKKQHFLDPHDPSLHKANIIERLRFRERFPALAA